jgi:hypothetical protein
MGLQGDHHRLILGLPIRYAGTGFHNGAGKFMPEGNFRENRFVSFMIEPGMKIGSANATVSDPEKNFIIFGRGDGELDQAGGPFFPGISAKGFH